MQLEKAINEAIVQWKTGEPVNADVDVRVRLLGRIFIMSSFICFK